MNEQTIDLNYRPHKKQVELHKACDVDSKYFFITAVAGRQSGKTLAAIAQLIKWTLEDKGCQAWVVSPTDSQSQAFYKKVYQALKESNLIKYNTRSKGNPQITLRNGSFIQFRSAGSKDSLRGVSLEYLIVDEAAYVDEDTINEVLLPALNVKGKKCLFTTTPKGRGNWIYGMYQKGQKKEEQKYYSLKFTSYDNPESNEEYINERKKAMPEQLFNQEFRAAFVDGGSVFENIHNLAQIKKEQLSQVNVDQDETYYGGIDVGLVNDHTVYTILDSNNNMVFFERMARRDVQHHKNRMRMITNKFQPKAVFIEVNGQGQPIFEELKREYSSFKPFTTTQKTKQEIIHNLVNKFNTEEITIINDENVINELEGYGYKVTTNGQLKFENVGCDHDDIVMSLALAQECKNKKQFSANRDPKDIIAGFDL